MGRGPNLDPEFDEFNSWATWIADHDGDGAWPEPTDRSDDGAATREP